MAAIDEYLKQHPHALDVLNKRSCAVLGESLARDHPTCARPDGTAWCGHYDEEFPDGISIPNIHRCGLLGLWFDRTRPLPTAFFCSEWKERHDALADNPTEE